MTALTVPELVADITAALDRGEREVHYACCVADRMACGAPKHTMVANETADVTCRSCIEVEDQYTCLLGECPE